MRFTYHVLYRNLSHAVKYLVSRLSLWRCLLYVAHGKSYPKFENYQTRFRINRHGIVMRHISVKLKRTIMSVIFMQFTSINCFSNKPNNTHSICEMRSMLEYNFGKLKCYVLWQVIHNLLSTYGNRHKILHLVLNCDVVYKDVARQPNKPITQNVRKYSKTTPCVPAEVVSKYHPCNFT